MNIVDDFLDYGSHQLIKESLEYRDFWTFDPYKAGGSSGIQDGQLTHNFYFEMERSPHIEVLLPILHRVKPLAIWRIKANLQLHGGDSPYKSNWHYDFTGDGYPVSDMMTAIYYVNSNNGYTEFNDCKVESVSNRMVFFPSNTKHRGVNATNVKARYVINFNYFPMRLDKS